MYVFANLSLVEATASQQSWTKRGEQNNAPRGA